MLRPILQRLEGTIMIFALVIILGGTLVLAAWAQMMATRTTYTAMTIEGQKRRIAMENGRLLARQYVLNNMPSSNAFLGSSYSLTGGWGGFNLQVPPQNPWNNTNFFAANPFNPIAMESFRVVVAAKLFNDVETNDWSYIIRSRSPLLAGFPLVVQYPGSTNMSASLTYPAQKIFQENLLGFSSAAAIPFTSGTNSSGSQTNAYIGYFASPMNLAYSAIDISVTYPSNTFSPIGALQVGNAVTNGTNVTRNYSGGAVSASISNTQTDTILRYNVPTFIGNVFTLTHLETNSSIVNNTIYQTNDVVTQVTNYTYTTNRNGKIKTHTTITKSTNTTVTSTNVTVTNWATNNYVDNYSNSSVTNLVLYASTQTNSLHIISASTNLATITLTNTNNTRMVYVNHSGGNLAIATATTNENYIWWLGLSIANSTPTLEIKAPTGTKKLTIKGGIRTDRDLAITRGYVTLTPNPIPAISGTNVSPIEFMTDRMLWLEDGKASPTNSP